MSTYYRGWKSLLVGGIQYIQYLGIPGKNRHHLALFVRNCKLVLLLRKEYQEGEENTFRPAEWRWKLPQVCDDEWHHYAVNVNFPVVTLVVDGEEWTDQKDNPEIIDDWPLHPADDITTRVSIGACWQGQFY